VRAWVVRRAGPHGRGNRGRRPIRRAEEIPADSRAFLSMRIKCNLLIGRKTSSEAVVGAWPTKVGTVGLRSGTGDQRTGFILKPRLGFLPELSWSGL